MVGHTHTDRTRITTREKDRVDPKILEVRQWVELSHQGRGQESGERKNLKKWVENKWKGWGQSLRGCRMMLLRIINGIKKNGSNNTDSSLLIFCMIFRLWINFSVSWVILTWTTLFFNLNCYPLKIFKVEVKESYTCWPLHFMETNYKMSTIIYFICRTYCLSITFVSLSSRFFFLVSLYGP